MTIKIVTRQNVDGTFDEVGMRNRGIMPDFKAPWRERKWLQEFGKGAKVRVESFSTSRPYAKPLKTEYKDTGS